MDHKKTQNSAQTPPQNRQKTAKSARKARLADALRANLRRRKAPDTGSPRGS